MKLIKLNAIDSTSSFLKEYSNTNKCQNFTVVMATNQTQGRGQLGASWQSLSGKNLTFSILINELMLNAECQFRLSMMVSLAVSDVLKEIIPYKIHVKWPNDILADGNKIAGILIENTIIKNEIVKTIIGIGLNVNQTVFPKEILRVTSIKKCIGLEKGLDDLLIKIVNRIKTYCKLLLEENKTQLAQMYYKNLYKFNTPTMFRNKQNELFMAKIVDVTANGQLVLEHTNESLVSYDLKQIRLNEF